MTEEFIFYISSLNFVTSTNDECEPVPWAGDLWCCYITVDSAMAASQNGFCSYKLSIHKKTNIMQIMKKILQFLFT
jgi:hypothetical protein